MPSSWPVMHSWSWAWRAASAWARVAWSMSRETSKAIAAPARMVSTARATLTRTSRLETTRRTSTAGRAVIGPPPAVARR
jgi:hypothetical protein